MKTPSKTRRTPQAVPAKSIALLFICALLTGCASFFEAQQDPYTWHRVGPASDRVEWNHVTDPHKYGCGQGAYACAVQLNGHVSGKTTCVVFSALSETEAKAWRPRGSFYTLWQHEVEARNAAGDIVAGHCAGFRHHEAHLPDFFSYGGKGR